VVTVGVERQDKMKPHMLLCLVILGLAAGVAFYYAVDESSGPNVPIPQFESEAQFAGLDVKSGFTLGGNGGPLDMRPEIHMFDWDAYGCAQVQPIVTPHRYPLVAGGNITSVINKGIVSACCDNAPDSDWYRNPPEAAVL
jgi:hypothetical protein